MTQAKLQNQIKEQYGDRLKEARKRLCPNCRNGEFYEDRFKQCHHGLIPICSDGSDCNYFDKREKVGEN